MAKVGLLARQALSGKQCCMQLGRVRWANAELLACQAKDAMRRLKLTTLKLRLTRVHLQRYACAFWRSWASR